MGENSGRCYGSSNMDSKPERRKKRLPSTWFLCLNRHLWHGSCKRRATGCPHSQRPCQESSHNGGNTLPLSKGIGFPLMISPDDSVVSIQPHIAKGGIHKIRSIWHVDETRVPEITATNILAGAGPIPSQYPYHLRCRTQPRRKFVLRSRVYREGKLLPNRFERRLSSSVHLPSVMFKLEAARNLKRTSSELGFFPS